MPGMKMRKWRIRILNPSFLTLKLRKDCQHIEINTELIGNCTQTMMSRNPGTDLLLACQPTHPLKRPEQNTRPFPFSMRCSSNYKSTSFSYSWHLTKQNFSKLL